MQVNVKKRLLYGAIVFTWIFIPLLLTAIGSVGTDIIRGTCVPFGAFSSYAAAVALVSSAILITYLLPLMLMTFCYIRIVYELRYKVSSGGFRFCEKARSSGCICRNEKLRGEWVLAEERGGGRYRKTL